MMQLASIRNGGSMINNNIGGKDKLLHSIFHNFDLSLCPIRLYGHERLSIIQQPRASPGPKI